MGPPLEPRKKRKPNGGIKTEDDTVYQHRRKKSRTHERYDQARDRDGWTENEKRFEPPHESNGPVGKRPKSEKVADE